MDADKNLTANGREFTRNRLVPGSVPRRQVDGEQELRDELKSIGHSPSSLPSFASIRGLSVICGWFPVPLPLLPPQTVEVNNHDDQAAGDNPLPE
jgi:hypothetical protein